MKNREKLIVKMAALLLSSLLLCGCSLFDFGIANPVNSGDEIEGEDPGRPMDLAFPADGLFSLNYDPNAAINPLVSASETNLMFAPLVYESLFELDENLNVSPTRLVSECSSDDGITWRINIDTDVLMHDGSALTASDVSYSISYAMTSSLYKTQLGNVVGCGAYAEDLVIITLSRPNYLFGARLRIPIIKNGSLDMDTPPGTGPYVVNESKTALELDPAHPDAAEMPIDKINLMRYTGAEEKLAAFEDSKLDLVVNDPSGMNDLGFGNANIVRYIATTNMHYIGFNTDRLFFASAPTRHAVTFAINREHIVTGIMGGSAIAATLPISPLSAFYNAAYSSSFDFSMEKAKAAFKNAEVEDFDDDMVLEHMVTGIPVEVSLDFIVNNDSPHKIAAARSIAENLQSLGITINVRELEWNSYLKALSDGDFDMYYAEVKLTADFDLSSLLSTGGSLNYGKLRDDAATARINEYLSAGDEDRLMKAELMCQYLVDTAPIIAVAFERQELITHRGVVTGTAPTQYNVFNKFADWKIVVR